MRQDEIQDQPPGLDTPVAIRWGGRWFKFMFPFLAICVEGVFCVQHLGNGPGGLEPSH